VEITIHPSLAGKNIAELQMGRGTLMSVELISNFIGQARDEVLLVLTILNLILLLVVLIQGRKIAGLDKCYRRMMQGHEGLDLETHLVKNNEAVQQVYQELNDINKTTQQLRQQISAAIQQVGVVRFNAFPDMGSDLSYAVALLDQDGSGIVLSGIYGREDSRTFVKPVERYKSSYRLSQEEQAAIERAVAAEEHLKDAN